MADDESGAVGLNVHFDASAAVRASARPSLGGPVRGPGQAAPAAQAAGGRRPRPASEVTGADAAGARHNWIPRGPRNVGGRVRCLAVDPNNPLVLYAGPASGGVYKSVDGGETWFPLWHDEASLSMAAISVCPANSQVVWAATGESRVANRVVVPGDGVLRSENGGTTWTGAGPVPAGPPPPVFADLRILRFHAIAAHPTKVNVCWAVGPNGAYLTRDGGRTWMEYSGPFSDVAFAGTGAARRLFLVRSGAIGDGRQGVVVRLADPEPDAGPAPNDAAIDAIIRPQLPDTGTPAPGVRSTTPVGAGTGRPADGKIAICRDTPNIAYLRFASRDADRDDGHYGVFRARNAMSAAANAITWQALADHPAFVGERQGNYNLTIAVSPTNANHVATGMVDFHLTLNGNADNATTTNRWIRGLAWDLFLLDRGQHADHHQTVFAPATADVGAPIVLWDANDGGISRSDNWAAATTGYADGDTTLPLPDGVVTWRKMSHGITAPQMYDLTQSPLLPTVYACGFQDNGIWITTGGPSWTPVMAADGGFVAFDPDDPYRFVVTWQEGIAGGVFPGQVRTAHPRTGLIVQGEVWPRVMHDGFEAVDVPLFVGETAFDPHHPGVLLHARANRLYATRPRTGDRWHIQPVGAAVELIYVPPANPDQALLEIRDGPAARVLGLLSSHARGRFDVDQGRRVLRPARLRGLQPGPYRLDPASTLDVVLNGTVRTVRFAPGPDLPDPARATPAQVAARITTDVGNGLRALPLVWATSDVVQVRTRAAGGRITVAGDPALFIGITERVYSGDDDLPALLTFQYSETGTLDLTIDGGGGVRHIVFPPPAVGQDDRLTALQMAERIRTGLGDDPAQVTTAPAFVGLRFSATAPNRTVRLTGTAVNALNLTPGPTPPQPTLLAVARVAGFNLEPGDPAENLTLTIGDGTNTAAELVLSPANLGLPAGTDRSSMTAVELRRVLRRHIPGRVQVRVDAVVIDDPGEVSEIHFPANHPGHVWVGDTSGRLHHSSDGGTTWQSVTGPFTDGDVIEAIAVHPTAARTVYVGTYQPQGRKTPLAFLHRSTDEGAHWEPVAGGVEDSDHRQVGINALEIDPDDPRTLWAATDIGVFRTTDEAASWHPFNHGLPNTKVRDLAFVPTTRTLRAGAWGRGTWERHVGDREVKDVRLYVRANEADDGTVRPAGTALDALAPTPSRVSPAQSPDIKVARSLPPVGTFLDGVELDEDVRHEDVVPGLAQLLVQVHNGGSFPTTQPVRVAVLWAFADSGPPVLPAGFWTTFHNGALTAGNTHGGWTVAFDAPLHPGPAGAGHDVVPPGDPRVLRQPVDWPAAVAEHRAVGLLAVVTGSDDPIGTDLPLDVAGLLDRERRVAYRECTVLHAEDDRRIVLRSTNHPAIPVRALARGAGFSDLTAPGNPLGMPGGPLPPVAVLTGEAPFDLTRPPATPFGLRFESTHDIVVTFAPGDPNLPNLARVSTQEVAGVIERALRAADVPVGALLWFQRGTGADMIAIRCRAPATFRLVAAGSTAAATFGLPTDATERTFMESATNRLGPWNLTGPPGSPLALHIRLTNRADLSFPNPTRGIANRAAASAAEIRAVLNRALDLARSPLRAEPRLLGLAVRRSVTEAAGTSERIGGPGVADLVVSHDAVAEADRAGRFAVFAASDADRLTAGDTNRLYVRVLNLGNVRVEAARVRVLLLDPDVSSVTAAEVAARADVALDPGATAIVELTWAVPALVSGSRVELLVVADLPAGGPDPRRPIVVPPDLADMDALDAHCATHPGMAWRQVVVA